MTVAFLTLFNIVLVQHTFTSCHDFGLSLLERATGPECQAKDMTHTGTVATVLNHVCERLRHAHALLTAHRREEGLQAMDNAHLVLLQVLEHSEEDNVAVDNRLKEALSWLDLSEQAFAQCFHSPSSRGEP